MNNLTSTFSLYEVFRILMPGTYVSLAFLDFFEKWNLDYEVFSDNALETTLNIIVIILVGLFFYSWDIPKVLRRFQKNLPSLKIKERHPHIDNEIILNSYLDFYDELDIEFKVKHEKYSGYFHLSLNMIVTSIIIFIVGFISWWIGFFSYFVPISMFIVILSIVTAVNIYYFRLKRSYTRHLKKYYDSEYYQDILNK